MDVTKVTNKKSLAEMVSERFSMTKKEAAEIIDAVFDEMSDTLAEDGHVEITGFGKFAVKTRASRKGVNPQTGEDIQIAPSRIPGFKASKNLKEKVRSK
ncbi:MAG: HU family DNA-binding protein [Erysipelotrichaceae bacterium]|jgi:DNA-binding protein HU-beta